jgi:hypothetical protein
VPSLNSKCPHADSEEYRCRLQFQGCNDGQLKRYPPAEDKAIGIYYSLSSNMPENDSRRSERRGALSTSNTKSLIYFLLNTHTGENDDRGSFDGSRDEEGKAGEETPRTLLHKWRIVEFVDSASTLEAKEYIL